MLSITFSKQGSTLKPEVLQIGPYPAWDEESLDAVFTMHRLFEAGDKGAFKAHGAGIRAIATRGELGGP